MSDGNMSDPGESPPASRIRPATFDDGEAIRRVHKTNGLDDFDPEKSRAIGQSYPFAAEFGDIPTGWVLETDGGSVVGTIGNIPLMYELDGRRLRAALATAWGVDEAHRGRALHLTTAFFKQKGLDLLLNGSASPTASRVLSGLQIPRIPVPDYSSPCFWAANPRAFAKAVLRRRKAAAADLLSWPAGLALLVRDILRGSGRGRPSAPVRRLSGFNDSFDALWTRIATGAPRLRAIRTRAVLDWKYGAEVAAGRAAILAAETGGELSGYAVLVRRSGSDLGMGLYDVADLQAAGDEPSVYRDLLLASVRLARDEGVDAVKLMTGTPARRAPALALQPYTYQLPFWQLYYRAAPELRQALATADKWDFSLFDTY
jgi:hypothetical protein